MAITGKDINKAKELLTAGELVAIPTETVYGLSGNALNLTSVTRIFEVKNRPRFDPLIVHVSDIGAAAMYVENVPELAHKLVARFWPGPLTLLLKRKPIIPDLVTSGLPTVGIRCPNHPLTQSLLRQLPFPIAAPSANPFGYVSPTTPEHVAEQLGDKIPYILDGGACQVGIESTIIGFDSGLPIVYRLGGLTIEAIESVVGKVYANGHSTSNPVAPGQLQQHYSPSTKIVVGNIEELLLKHANEEVAVLSFQKSYPVKHQEILSLTGDLDEAAQHLFAAMRTLDRLSVSLILAEQVPNHGLGRAINDRLQRAAAR